MTDERDDNVTSLDAYREKRGKPDAPEDEFEDFEAHMATMLALPLARVFVSITEREDGEIVLYMANYNPETEVGSEGTCLVADVEQAFELIRHLDWSTR